MLHTAVFLDKDGTLVENVPYNADPEKLRFLPGVLEGLRRLHEAGYLLVVVTNQSGIARGYFTEDQFHELDRHIRAETARAGAPLAGLYYCPHYPGGIVPGYDIACNCRKPEPGLIVRAAHDLKIDAARSWSVGDILNDVEAGRRAGCRSVLIDNGTETEWVLTTERLPHHVVSCAAEAVNVILALDAAGRHTTITAEPLLRTAPLPLVCTEGKHAGRQ